MPKQPLRHLSSFGDDTSPNGDSQQPPIKFPVFREQLRSASHAKGLNSAKIAGILGVTRGTMARYWNGERLPPADQTLQIAEELDVSVRKLLTGRDDRARRNMMDANEADWHWVEEYDLSTLTDDSKGTVVETTPFRRDWLAQRFGNISGLWLTRMPQRFTPFGLDEGDLVFVRDVAKGEHNQGAAYLLRRDGMLSAAILDAHADRVSEERIPFRHFGYDDGQAVPVARILGAPLVRF